MDTMLRLPVQRLGEWDWDLYRDELSQQLPLRWWAVQHIAANPRDIQLSYEPFTKKNLQYVYVDDDVLMCAC